MCSQTHSNRYRHLIWESAPLIDLKANISLKETACSMQIDKVTTSLPHGNKPQRTCQMLWHHYSRAPSSYSFLTQLRSSTWHRFDFLVVCFCWDMCGDLSCRWVGLEPKVSRRVLTHKTTWAWTWCPRWSLIYQLTHINHCCSESELCQTQPS